MSLHSYQPAFVGGEISRTIFGRVDKDLYFRGADKLRNVYVSPQGYVFRREGLEYVDTTPSSVAVRLVPFSFNTEQSYLLEFSAGQFRVFKDDAVVATVTSSPVSALTAAQVQEMKWTQSADTLILVHPDVQPIEITRTSDTVWTTASISFTNIPPFAFGAITVTEPAADITPSAKTGKDVTVTASASVFTSGHVGQYINIKEGGLIFITAYTSGTVVTGDVQSDLADTSAVTSGNWELETGYEDVWSSGKGWPVSVTFFQGGLWFGGSKSRPQTIWRSNIADFYNFDVGSGLADEAIDVTIDDDQVNAIQNIFAGRNLQVYTTGGEFYIPTDPGTPVTPENARLIKATQHGSVNARPISVDGVTLFVEGDDAGGGYVVRQFVFNEVEQSYNANDISLQSSHLIRAPKRVAVRGSTESSPTNYVYMVNEDDGTVAVLNMMRSQKLLAWTMFETNAGGEFEDVVVLDREVYFVVKRTINSATVRYIEKLNATHFTDASKTATGSAQTAWSGFAHLNGETVKVRGDDFMLEDAAVSGGSFTSSEAVDDVEAGINFAAKVTLLPVEAPEQSRIKTGDYRRLVFVNIHLYQSRNVVVQQGSKTFKPPFRNFGDGVLDDPITLFDGWKKVYLNGVDRNAQLTITQEEPLEFQLLAVDVGLR
jgi:hypothetical protein